MHPAPLGVLEASRRLPPELVGLALAGGEDPVEVGEGQRGGVAPQAEPHDPRAARGQAHRVPERELRALAVPSQPLAVAPYHGVVEGVLDRARGRVTVEPGEVRVVVAEEHLRRILPLEVQHPEPRVVGLRQSWPEERDARPLRRAAAPGPGVPEPQLREHVHHARSRRAADDREADEEVLGLGLGVLDEELAPAAVEDPGVHQLQLGHVPAAQPVLVSKRLVGERGERVAVERLQIRARRHRVEVVVLLLHVLAVVALQPPEPEEPLLQDGVAAVPQRRREAEQPLVVGDAEQPVLAPAVGAAAGVLVGKVRPGGAAGAVVLPHRPPLPLGEVRPPPAPGLAPLVGFAQPLSLGAHAW